MSDVITSARKTLKTNLSFGGGGGGSSTGGTNQNNPTGPTNSFKKDNVSSQPSYNTDQASKSVVCGAVAGVVGAGVLAGTGYFTKNGYAAAAAAGAATTGTYDRCMR